MNSYLKKALFFIVISFIVLPVISMENSNTVLMQKEKKFLLDLRNKLQNQYKLTENKDFLQGVDRCSRQLEQLESKLEQANMDNKKMDNKKSEQKLEVPVKYFDLQLLNKYKSVGIYPFIMPKPAQLKSVKLSDLD